MTDKSRHEEFEGRADVYLDSLNGAHTVARVDGSEWTFERTELVTMLAEFAGRNCDVERLVSPRLLRENRELREALENLYYATIQAESGAILNSVQMAFRKVAKSQARAALAPKTEAQEQAQ